jgi:hypothetical protein
MTARVPEVMTLSVGIRNMSATDPLYFVKQRAVGQSRQSQICPITPAATRDHVVNGGEGEALMVQVSVQHEKVNQV